MSEPFKMSLEDVAGAAYAFGVRLPAIINNCPDIVDYQVPKKGDRIATSDGQEWICPGPSIDAPFSSKYFIRRPRKKVTVTDYVFKATGETRRPRGGEWILFERSGDLSYVEPNVNLQDEYPIYTREAVTREIEVDE